MNVAAHQEKKKKNEKTFKRKAGEDRPILKRLRATLLQVFKGLHDKKNGLCKGNAQGNWDSQKGQQPF